MDEDDLRRHLRDMAVGDAPQAASVRLRMDAVRRAAHRRRQRLSIAAAAAVVVAVTGTVTLVATGSHRPVEPAGRVTTSVDTGGPRPHPVAPAISTAPSARPDVLTPTRRSSPGASIVPSAPVTSSPRPVPSTAPAPATPGATRRSNPIVRSVPPVPAPTNALQVTQVPGSSEPPTVLILSPSPAG